MTAEPTTAGSPGSGREVVPLTEAVDRRSALHAGGPLAALNRAGVLVAADVHVAALLSRLSGTSDPRVVVAGALAVRAVRTGSVCLDLDTVAEALPEVAAVVDLTGVAEALDAAEALHGVLHRDGHRLYLDRYWREESQVVADLRERAAAAAPVLDEAALAAALDRHLPGRQSADQRAAVEAACRHWTAVVTGGPGTGKTTTIARLLAVLLETEGADLRVALAAPTGKAAARMAEAVRQATDGSGPGGSGVAERVRALRATTLHRLLGPLPGTRTRFRHHRSNRLPHDVVIVDETSMVSLTMTARLLEAVRPSARLVLVGDADQLASVEAGAVLSDLVVGLERERGGTPVRRLGPTRRFGEAIGRLADAVRAGDADAVLAELSAGDDAVVWLPPEELPAVLAGHALALRDAAEAGPPEAALAAVERHRLLCAHREGPAGAGHWNREVERLLRQDRGLDRLPEWYAGRPLLVNANDEGLRLWNGDTGVVVRDPAAPGGLVAVLGDGADARIRLTPSRLADVSTAHAMTVHRSQGSQFAEVTVLLPDPESRILTRELLYTALTRARSRVRVVGDEASVRAAVTRQAQRATGLADRLRRP